jgi:hypothetical protein
LAQLLPAPPLAPQSRARLLVPLLPVPPLPVPPLPAPPLLAPRLEQSSLLV